MIVFIMNMTKIVLQSFVFGDVDPMTNWIGDCAWPDDVKPRRMMHGSVVQEIVPGTRFERATPALGERCSIH